LKQSRFTESQIASILKQQNAGAKVMDICREHGFSDATFYNWKAKYGGMAPSQLKRLKELNQVELSKYFVGTWQCEMAKDTFKVCTYKPLGNGMDANIKIVTKGKTLEEGKLLYGYDKKSDKFIQSIVMPGSDILVSPFWFTSQNTGEGILLEDFSNSNNASLEMKLEIKSPDLWSTTSQENNKTIGTYTYARVKN
jgi:putative transposase